MFKWKWQVMENRIEWRLVHEDDETKVIGSVISTEEMDVWKIEAECKEIGYKEMQEGIDKKLVGTIVSNMKKSIQEDVENSKVRKIYEMVDGMPIWQHLTNGAKDNKVNLIGPDYGKFAEILGRRILRILTRKGGILDDIFSDLCILSTKRVYGVGDLALEIHCKYENGENSTFGKKIVIFEIKHGRFQIEQNQLRRYCSMIDDPGKHFPKADEVKVIYMMFNKIDTLGCSASYSVRELDKNLAHRILESSPITQYPEENSVNNTVLLDGERICNMEGEE